MKDATSLEFKHSDASSNAASLAQFLGSIVAVRLVVPVGSNVMIYSTCNTARTSSVRSSVIVIAGVCVDTFDVCIFGTIPL